MKIREIITEAYIDFEIKRILTQKGYKFLDKGQDQDAFIAPDGTILKIFGWDNYQRKGQSKGQRSFIAFADYCRKNSSNPLLPNILGWKTFNFKGNTYLQIKVERLFPLKKNFDIRESLENLVNAVSRLGPEKGLRDWFEGSSEKNVSLISMLLGEENLNLLAKTIYDLKRIAKSEGYIFDLHGDNFMLSSDGDIVINDPFFTGTVRNYK